MRQSECDFTRLFIFTSVAVLLEIGKTFNSEPDVGAAYALGHREHVNNEKDDELSRKSLDSNNWPRTSLW